MYIPAAEQKKVFEEVFRVLESKGRFLIWDVNLPQRLDEEKDIVVIFLEVELPDRKIETGYGTKWPEKIQDLSYYKNIANQVGFIITEQVEDESIFFLELQKP